MSLFQVVLKNSLHVTSIVFLSILLLLMSVPAHASDSIQIIPGEYVLVEAEEDVFSRSFDSRTATTKTTLRKLPSARGLSAQNGSYDPAKIEKDCQLLLDQNPQALFCEPNALVSIDAIPNDPRYSELKGMKNINAPKAWEVTTGSDSVIVAVLDTGVDYLHPDLIDNMWTNSGEIPGNGLDDDNNGWIDDVYGVDLFNKDGDPRDDHSHGTHCAGTIGGTGNNAIGVAGVNWDVQIMAIKFLSRTGSGSTFDAATGLDYAVENGATVINASFGGGFASQALKLAIERAEKKGVLFVAASGNSAKDTDATPHYPSGFKVDNVLSVAAVDAKDKLAFFSNYGSNTVDLAAPGVQILSTVTGGGYGSMSGTSMAAPHVAGLAALILSAHPEYNALDLKNTLINTVDRISGLQNKVLSAGRINASKAVGGDTSPAPGGENPSDASAKIVDFSGPNGSSRLVRNKQFTISLAGTAGESVGLNLVFEGRRAESTCSLGQLTLDAQTGFTEISSELRISKRLQRGTKKVVLRAGEERKTRKLRRKSSGLRSQSSTVRGMRERKFTRLAGSACKRILRSLSSQ